MLWYAAVGVSPALRAFLTEHVGAVDAERWRFAFDPLGGVLHWQRVDSATGGDGDAAVLEDGEVAVPAELLDECAERF